MARDYVCSMHAEENTPFVTEYEGKRYYFCSEACKNPLTDTHKNMMIWPRNFLMAD